MIQSLLTKKVEIKVKLSNSIPKSKYVQLRPYSLDEKLQDNLFIKYLVN